MKALLLVLFLVCHLTTHAQTINVEVSKIENTKGKLVVSLYDNEDDFLKNPVKEKKLNITGDRLTVSFENVKQGVYTIGVYHDEDGDGELDTNWFNIPTEQIGVSNNARPNFGPPDYDEAKFTVKQSDVTLKIEMQE